MNIDTTAIAIKDLKTLEKAIKEIKKARSFARKIRKQIADGSMDKVKGESFLVRANDIAVSNAICLTQCCFAIGQGDDADREKLGESIAAKLMA